MFDPLWAAIQDANLPVTFHVSTGRDPRAARGNGGAVINYVSHSLSPTIEPVANLCASGVLRALPAPARGHDRGRHRLGRRGSWARWTRRTASTTSGCGRSSSACRASTTASTAWPRSRRIRPASPLAEPMNLADNFMWGNDYPHHEGTWPHSAEAIERTMGQLSDGRARQDARPERRAPVRLRGAGGVRAGEPPRGPRRHGAATGPIARRAGCGHPGAGLTRREGLALHEVSAQLEAPKSSLLPLLRALTARGYLAQGPRRRVSPRPAGLRAGRAAGRPRLAEVARPALVELMRRTGETVFLGTLAATAAVVFVDKVESEQIIRYAAGVGDRRPLHATSSGKAILAYLPPEQREKISSAAARAPHRADGDEPGRAGRHARRDPAQPACASASTRWCGARPASPRRSSIASRRSPASVRSPARPTACAPQARRWPARPSARRRPSPPCSAIGPSTTANRPGGHHESRHLAQHV